MEYWLLHHWEVNVWYHATSYILLALLTYCIHFQKCAMLFILFQKMPLDITNCGCTLLVKESCQHLMRFQMWWSFRDPVPFWGISYPRSHYYFNVDLREADFRRSWTRHLRFSFSFVWKKHKTSSGWKNNGWQTKQSPAYSSTYYTDVY